MLPNHNTMNHSPNRKPYLLDGTQARFFPRLNLLQHKKQMIQPKANPAEQKSQI